MDRPTRSPHRLRGCVLASLAYLMSTGLCVWLLRDVIDGAPLGLRAVVSLLPVIPIGFTIREVLHLMRASDELQRRIDLEALATAALAVGLACLSLGLLVGADVLDISGKAALNWMFPALSVAYLVARVRAQRRYR